MQIQLVNPPIYFNKRSIQATRPSLPLGLAYLAAAILEQGHGVGIVDAVTEAPDRITPDGKLHYFGLNPDEIAERVDPGTDIVGVGAMFSFTWPLVKRIVKSIKARHPDKLVVLGGEHVTGMSEYSLRAAPVDLLVCGEGESTIQELLPALERGETDLSGIEGLAYLRDGEFVATPRRKRIRDVDALRRPAWDLFDPAAYYRHGHVMGVDAGFSMPILATRGCPYACTFCSNPMMWGRSWFARDPGHVVDEIQEYHEKYGATSFPFHDLTAILKRQWIVDFCTEVIDRGLDVSWQLPIGTRCEVVDDEVAELLRRSRGNSLSFAPESGSKRTRDLLGKKMTEEALMSAVDASVKAGLNVSIFYVAGFPHDTREDLRESRRLAFRLARAGANDIALSYFFPIPGTQLFDGLVESGRIVPSDTVLLAPSFAMEAALSEAYNFCEHLSARELTRAKVQILLVFYLTSFFVRPWRIFQLTWNGLRGKETCKVDIFLNNRRRRLLRWLRDLFRGVPTPERLRGET